MAPQIPSTQKAVIASPTGDIIISDQVPVIELEDDAVIIKNRAVALNPVDTKLVGDFITPGAIFGFDCAGTIVAIGSKVTRDLKVGDRVCGSADGMSRERPAGGAFAEYVSLPGDLALKIPESVSFEEAAALGTGLASAGIALFYSLGLPASYLDKPAEKPFPVLIYGGSSATGTMAIQLLKL
jgi:NADPH:quinone reductase-like Zn-dependent oxidoreductase